jgi:hypothetical protein
VLFGYYPKLLYNLSFVMKEFAPLHPGLALPTSATGATPTATRSKMPREAGRAGLQKARKCLKESTFWWDLKCEGPDGNGTWINRVFGI